MFHEPLEQVRGSTFARNVPPYPFVRRVPTPSILEDPTAAFGDGQCPPAKSPLLILLETLETGNSWNEIQFPFQNK